MLVFHSNTSVTYSCIISQFLDESSNLKAGCKLFMVHLMPFMCHNNYIDNRSRDFFMDFFHFRPIMVDTVHSLPPEPAVLCVHDIKHTCIIIILL